MIESRKSCPEENFGLRNAKFPHSNLYIQCIKSYQSRNLHSLHLSWIKYPKLSDIPEHIQVLRYAGCLRYSEVQSKFPNVPEL